MFDPFSTEKICEKLDNIFLAIVASEQHKMGMIPDAMYEKCLYEVAAALNNEDRNKSTGVNKNEENKI